MFKFVSENCTLHILTSNGYTDCHCDIQCFLWPSGSTMKKNTIWVSHALGCWKYLLVMFSMLQFETKMPWPSNFLMFPQALWCSHFSASTRTMINDIKIYWKIAINEQLTICFGQHTCVSANLSHVACGFMRNFREILFTATKAHILLNS